MNYPSPSDPPATTADSHGASGQGPSDEARDAIPENATRSDNADQAEIDKFSSLASQWWDPAGDLRTLHEINPLRLDYIERHSASPEQSGLQGKRIIDVGCGGGLLAEAMASRGASVTGIDLAEASLAVARLHALESGVSVEYLQISAESCAEQMPGCADIVTCLELLEHIPAPEKIVSACARMAKPGGRVFFSTLNRNRKAWLQAIVAAEHVLKLLPAGTHDYQRFIRPSELARWCRDADLEIEDMTGMTYNPLTRRYRLHDDVAVNYLVAATRRDEQQ